MEYSPMTADTFPRLRAAAVHAAPAFLDRDATLDKIDSLTAAAVARGAELVVFGESFLPGFPVWTNVLPPVDQTPFFLRLFSNAITVPGPEHDHLAALARRYRATLSIGVSEKSSTSMGSMWNANLVFSANGELINHRRKLVPTWAERLAWGYGDAAQLSPFAAGDLRLGVLICGENTNTLARFALLSQGEQIHIATYPPVWPFSRELSQDYDLAEAIRMRTAAHSFEGKVFSIVAATTLDQVAVDQIAAVDERARGLLTSSAQAVSMVLGPSGELLAGPVTGGDQLLVADIDVNESISLKQIHDIVGVYQRFDLFSLTMDQSRPQPIHLSGGHLRRTPVVPDEASHETSKVAGDTFGIEPDRV
jgi:nitrilase/aliphatic nitrilase